MLKFAGMYLLRQSIFGINPLPTTISLLYILTIKLNIMASQFFPLKNWSKSNGQKKAGFATNTVTKMTGNANFASPGTTINGGVVLTVMTAAANDLAAKYLLRLNGTEAAGQYNTANVLMETLLVKQCNYVNITSGGDPDKIKSSGFNCSAETDSKSVIPPTPGPAIIGINGDGAISVSTPKVDGADDYCTVIFIGEVTSVSVIGKYISFPNGGVTIVIPRAGLHEIVTGLTPGTKVTVMTLAQNAAGKSAFSTPVSKFVS